MTFTLSLLTSSASEVDWSRPLMMGWIVIALGLSLIEIWLAGAFRRGAFRKALPQKSKIIVGPGQYHLR